MSEPMSPKLLKGLCDGATARGEFEEKFLICSIYYGAARGNDAKTAALEELNLLSTEEEGAGTTYCHSTSQKTWTSKGSALLASFDSSSACWPTALGDLLTTGHFNKDRLNDTDTQTFIFPPWCSRRTFLMLSVICCAAMLSPVRCPPPPAAAAVAVVAALLIVCYAGGQCQASSMSIPRMPYAVGLLLSSMLPGHPSMPSLR